MAADGVELIEFFRPSKNVNNLYVTNISKDLSEEEAQCKLFKMFSKFGLLYEVQVFDARENTSEERQTSSRHDNDSRGFLYAFVKYYSIKAAAKAKKETNIKYLMGGQYIKVQFANRKKCIDKPVPLYMARCIELANFYLGFNGWSTSITKMEKLDEKENSVSQESETFMFRCTVRLEIKSHECYCEGTGYGGDRSLIFNQEKEPLKKLELTAIAKKVAHRHAFENAFQRVIIISLDNGKVAVEINKSDIPQSEINRIPEDGLIKVNYREELPSSDDEIHDDDILVQALNAITEF